MHHISSVTFFSLPLVLFYADVIKYFFLNQGPQVTFPQVEGGFHQEERMVPHKRHQDIGLRSGYGDLDPEG